MTVQDEGMAQGVDENLKVGGVVPLTETIVETTDVRIRLETCEPLIREAEAIKERSPLRGIEEDRTIDVKTHQTEADMTKIATTAGGVLETTMETAGAGVMTTTEVDTEAMMAEETGLTGGETTIIVKGIAETTIIDPTMLTMNL